MPDLPLGPLMVDVAGLEVSADEITFLSSPAVGGVILFGRNFESPEQVSILISKIKSIRNPALLVAVDQEGGRVQRFKNGFTILPPMDRFGQLHDENPGLAIELCRSAGRLMAAELVCTGVDFSFAPVLDCAKKGSRASYRRFPSQIACRPAFTGRIGEKRPGAFQEIDQQAWGNVNRPCTISGNR
jgi:beta-N-acetylhexosaminidase